MKRMTVKNPNGTYRLPLTRAGSIRMEKQMDSVAFFGDAINLLGEYETLGTPEEIRAAMKKSK